MYSAISCSDFCLVKFFFSYLNYLVSYKFAAFQLLNHDHAVNPVHERDVCVYNINTVDPNENK